MLLYVQTGAREQLLRFAEGGFLFAVLDATDCPAVPAKLRELGALRCASLFEGSAYQAYWAVAPHVVQVDAPLLQWIYDTLWPQPWGIFVMARADLASLGNHLQRFLVATLPDNKPWFFRYYDPRILPQFLRASNAEELADFFGPVRAFGIKDEEGNLTIVRRAGAGEAAARDTPMAPPVADAPQEQEPDQSVGEEDFAARLCAHVRDTYAAVVEGVPELELRIVVEQAIAAARMHELTDEASVTAFVSLLFSVSPRFFEHPYVQERLTNAKHPPDERLRLLIAETSEPQWLEIRQATMAQANVQQGSVHR